MNNITKGVFTVIGGLILIAVSAWIFSVVSKKVSPTPSDIPGVKAVECPSTIQGYQNVVNTSGQTARLISNRVSSFGENGKFKNKQIVIIKNETEKSKIACGYIFIRAGTETYGALQNWENIYINPDQFGGHISSKNHFGSGDGRNYSEYLFSLSKIQYWPRRDDRTIRNVDWASLLNVSGEITFEIALNTTDPTGFIDEVSIAYKCWNPKTGEENKDCKIEVKSTTDQIIEGL